MLVQGLGSLSRDRVIKQCEPTTKHMIKILIIMALIVIPSVAQAAVIGGSVYDLSLQKISGAVVEVDSTPRQQVISNTGDYRFNLAQGSYTITAKHIKAGKIIANATEKIIIDREGEFSLDLIVLPLLEDITIGDISLKESDFEESRIDLFLILGFGTVGIILIFLFLKNRHARKDKPVEVVREVLKPEIRVVKEIVREIREVKPDKLPEDLDKMMDIIRKNQGRVNQKDIRKELNLSEAKISLMVDDLEGRGLVKRIKKGRGNIVVLSGT